MTESKVGEIHHDNSNQAVKKMHSDVNHSTNIPGWSPGQQERESWWCVSAYLPCYPLLTLLSSSRPHDVCASGISGHSERVGTSLSDPVTMDRAAPEGITRHDQILKYETDAEHDQINR